MAIEREIRFRVIDGAPPAGGVRMQQAYLLRGPVTARIRIAEPCQGHAGTVEGGLRPRPQLPQHRGDGEDRADAKVAGAALHERRRVQ